MAKTVKKNVKGGDGKMTEKTYRNNMGAQSAFFEKDNHYYYMGVRGSAMVNTCHRAEFRSARCTGICTAIDMRKNFAQWSKCESVGMGVWSSGIACELNGANGGPFSRGYDVSRGGMVTAPRQLDWCNKNCVQVKHKMKWSEKPDGEDVVFYVWNQQANKKIENCEGLVNCGVNDAACGQRCRSLIRSAGNFTGTAITLEDYNKKYAKYKFQGRAALVPGDGGSSSSSRSSSDDGVSSLDDVSNDVSNAVGGRAGAGGGGARRNLRQRGGGGGLLPSLSRVNSILNRELDILAAKEGAGGSPSSL